MKSEEAFQWLNGIVKQRLLITNQRKGHQNELLMLHIAERLKRQLDGYPPQGDKIFEFIRRNYADILMIIPGNNSQQKNFDTLKKLALWTENRKRSNCSESIKNLQLHMPLWCS